LPENEKKIKKVCDEIFKIEGDNMVNIFDKFDKVKEIVRGKISK
jgi:hypothetical protein